MRLFRCVLRSRQMLEWKGKCASFSVWLFASHQRLSRHAHESNHPRAINSVSIHVLVRGLDFEPACNRRFLSVRKVALLAGVDGIEPPLSGPKPDALPFGYTPIRRFIAAPPTLSENIVYFCIRLHHHIFVDIDRNKDFKPVYFLSC